MVRLGFMLSVALGLIAAQPAGVRAAEKAYVNRKEPQREDRGWVERAECGAAVREGGRLVLRVDSGSIAVKTGKNGRVECQVRLSAYTPSEEEARRYFKNYELNLRQPESGIVYITSESPPESRRRGRWSIHFDLAVPLRFNLDLETQGGDVSVQSLQGELRVATAGGDVRTGDVSGPARIETAGGDISLGNIGQRLEAHTAGGGIRVGDVQGDATLETSGGEIAAGQIRGTVRAETAGGDIALRGASGPVIAETAGGQILIGQCENSIRAQTAGGSIRLQGARGMVQAESAGGSIDLLRMQSAIRAETTAGRILAEINANRHTFAASHLETHVGDILVFIPPDLPINIDAAIEQAFGHRIVSDFGLPVRGDQEGFERRSQRAEAHLNGGGKLLRIRTATGNIEIRKLDSQTLEEFNQRQENFWKRWQERQAQLLKEMQLRLKKLQEQQPPPEE